MILMSVREDNPGEFLLLAFDEFEIRKNQFDAWIIGSSEIQPEIDHDPLAAAAVEIDVHTDLARTAEGAKQ